MSAGELSSAATRHPWDWYVEESWVTQQLIDTLRGSLCGGHEDEFNGENVWDPCCGLGNVVRAFDQDQVSAFGSDIVQRWQSARFEFVHDFLSEEAAPCCLHHVGFPHSIVFNPPFSYQNGQLVRGLAERFVRKALAIATNKVCALLPVKWLASEGRHKLFTEHPPRFVLILSERPSMPPGDVVEALGKNAFKHGKVDFMWVVWDRHVETLPGETRTIWIAPRPKARKVRK